ncbi:MAG: zinc-binding dehydrogenase [Ilumatobacteraceae bacterium]
MMAVLLTGHGGFECLDVRDDVAVPAPAAGEVLVRVAAAGVNNTDINTRIGWYASESSASSSDPAIGWSGDVPAFPRIQGADACGCVVAVGPGVASTRVGERVVVEPVFHEPGRPAVYFGSEVDGAFAQYCVVPSQHAVQVACDWTDVELASIPCSYSAAENMLGRARVGAADTVVVTGASGGVGSAAVQLAARRGARVIGVASPGKHDTVAALGAAVVLDRGAGLREELGSRSVDVVIDVVGGPGWPQLLTVLRPGGRYATSGAIAGPLVELDLRTLYLNDLTLFGCTVLDRSVFADLVGYIERHEIRPVIAEVFPLREIVAAQQSFLTKQHVGKIVLEVGTG